MDRLRKQRFKVRTVKHAGPSDTQAEEEEPVPPDENMKVVTEIQISQTAALTREKHVSFVNLHIREYKQILGDHPCCGSGPPVMLGWDYLPERSISVDDYEAARSRRCKEDMRLSQDDRKEMLKETCSDTDVRRAQRKLHRERRGQDKRVKAFFQNPPASAVCD